jgi:hypothetical protein
MCKSAHRYQSNKTTTFIKHCTATYIYCIQRDVLPRAHVHIYFCVVADDSDQDDGNFNASQEISDINERINALQYFLKAAKAGNPDGIPGN